MTNRVACEMSDVIAAAAPVAGVLFESYDLETPHPMGWTKADDFVCAPENRIPILHTHNKMDIRLFRSMDHLEASAMDFLPSASLLRNGVSLTTSKILER